MSDTTEPQAKELTESAQDSVSQNTKETDNNTDTKSPDQIRAEFFVSDLDKKVTAESIPMAFAIIIDPKSQQPIIYAKGSTYTIARALVDMARYFKNKVVEEELTV
jgi:hypothetical protein